MQGLLALIRIAIWVIDPEFDDLKRGSEDKKTWHSEPYVSMSEEKLVLLRLSKLNVSTMSELYSDSLKIPKWVLDVLDLNEIEISRAFELAYSLYTENPDDSGWNKALDIFKNAQKFWDFPDGFMDWWIEAHALHPFHSERHEHRDFLGCRIIEDRNGRYHYLPYYQRLTHEFQFFGDPQSESKTIFTSSNRKSIDYTPTSGTVPEVGWPPSLPRETINFVRSGRKGSGHTLQPLNTRTPDSISNVKEMWDDIVGILRRDKTLVFRKQADFLKDPSRIGISPKTKTQDRRSSDSDTEASDLEPKTRRGTLRKIVSMRIFEKSRTV